MSRLLLAATCLFGLWLFGSLCALAQDKEETLSPIRALLVTGGSTHNYDLQQKILTAGIRQRLGRVVEWKVHLQGEGRSDVEIPLFENAAWAEGYDIVVHNYCFPRVYAEAYVDRILEPHRKGLPAVLIHGTMQSFPLRDERWYQFCGAESRSHGPHAPISISWATPAGPIVSGLENWKTPRGELYFLDQLLPGVTSLGQGQQEDVGEVHPVAWKHSYGSGKARVFATTIGNDPETMVNPVYLDMVTRGFLWALDSLDEESFKSVDPTIPIPGVNLPELHDEIRRPGKNLLSGSSVSALSTNVADGYLPDLAVDGDPHTFWESAKPGPVSLVMEMKEASPLSSLAVEWASEAPENFLVEGRSEDGNWNAFSQLERKESSRTSVLTGNDRHRYHRIRISVPVTAPSQTIGIREVSAFKTEGDVPVAYLVEQTPAKSLHAVGPGEEDRAIRLREGWTLQNLGHLQDGLSPSQLIETASGTLFVVAEKDDCDGALILSGSREDGTYRFTPFLDDLGSGACAVWDGEWLYVLEGTRFTSYRDTNNDGEADERFRSTRIFTPEGENGSGLSISSLQLTLDGWCYGILKGSEAIAGFGTQNELLDVPPHGLARFRRDGSHFQVVWKSPAPVLDFFHDDNLQLFVSMGENGVSNYHRLSAVTGPVMKSSDAVTFSWAASPALDGTASRVLLREENQIASLREALTAELIAEIDLPLLLSRRVGSGILSFKKTGKWQIAHLVNNDASPENLNLDEIAESELLPLLGAEDHQSRKEAGFEIPRRRKDLSDGLRALLDAPDASTYTSALAVTSLNPSREAFQDLVRAARRGGQPLAFRFLGDRPEAKNHVVFSKITKVKLPAVSAGILSAVEKSKTEAAGLETLALSMAASHETVLATAAQNFLIAREADTACFVALDDPGQAELHETAFSILSCITKASVAEGIVLRLEKTRDPTYRRAGLKAICDLYYLPTESGERWKSTPLLDAFLQASLSDHRVDASWLLDVMKTRGIPIENPGLLISLAKQEISLEPAVLRMVQGEAIPPESSEWLAGVSRDSSRDKALRIIALQLLLPLNELPFREAFSLAGDFAAIKEVEPYLYEIFAAWKQVECPPNQIAWLPQKATSGREIDSTLAWISFLELAQGEVDSAVDQKIQSTLNSVLSSGGKSVIGLLQAAEVVGDTRVGDWIALACQSSDSGVKETGLSIAARLDRNPATGKKREDPSRTGTTQQLAEELNSLAGDVKTGWKIFDREGCATCHNIHGEGPRFGPDIVQATAALSTSAFVASIREPAVKIDSGYGSHGFELTNGIRMQGIVESRNDDTLLIRDTGGNSVEVETSRVRWEWMSPASLMHGDFEGSLSATDLASLRAFLLHLNGSE
ncbi:MAG: ThuA domain-containing protein [Verrucomicrobiales bacterium]|nr:ThuA domain-containing protein [Verrucomicrobiales bacterium]